MIPYVLSNMQCSWLIVMMMMMMMVLMMMVILMIMMMMAKMMIIMMFINLCLFRKPFKTNSNCSCCILTLLNNYACTEVKQILALLNGIL